MNSKQQALVDLHQWTFALIGVFRTQPLLSSLVLEEIQDKQSAALIAAGLPGSSLVSVTATSLTVTFGDAHCRFTRRFDGRFAATPCRKWRANDELAIALYAL